MKYWQTLIRREFWEHRALWLAPAGAVPDLPELDASLWQWLDVHSGVATVSAPVVEAFVPQMLNYESVDGVNFKKGCYPGQEVVARSQYRGTLKRPELQPDDMAVLQYTGGTTGVSKGAVLLHRNVIANVLQSEAWNDPVMKRVPAGEQTTSVCALPLYHIFAFTVNMMLGMRTGGKAILIPNPRDLPAVLKELSKHTFHSFPAVNTLFNGLANHPDFSKVDWSHLKVSVGGGMAVQGAVAQRWLEKTGCPICEGYGLSETSPSVSCNPVDTVAWSGSIGLPMPSTEMRIIDDEGRELPQGQAGEPDTDNAGRVAFHRDYWDAAEELYEKLPGLGGLMRWLKRRAAE